MAYRLFRFALKTRSYSRRLRRPLNACDATDTTYGALGSWGETTVANTENPRTLAIVRALRAIHMRAAPVSGAAQYTNQRLGFRNSHEGRLV